MTKRKLHIKKGDMVKVVAGNDKGKEGRVLKVIPSKNEALVEDVNVRTKHVRPSDDNPKGGTTEKELPVHVSNLMVIDPSSGEPTRIGRKWKDDQWVRFSKKSGEIIE